MNTELLDEIRITYPQIDEAIGIVNKWCDDGIRFYTDAKQEGKPDANYDMPSTFFESTDNVFHVYDWLKVVVDKQIGFSGSDDRFGPTEAYTAVMNAITESMTAFGLAEEDYDDWRRKQDPNH